jgi:hypothetical protein
MSARPSLPDMSRMVDAAPPTATAGRTPLPKRGPAPPGVDPRPPGPYHHPLMDPDAPRRNTEHLRAAADNSLQGRIKNLDDQFTHQQRVMQMAKQTREAAQQTYSFVSADMGATQDLKNIALAAAQAAAAAETAAVEVMRRIQADQQALPTWSGGGVGALRQNWGS